MGIELELGLLFLLQTIGHSLFARFEVETAAWRKMLKWLLLAGLTVGLYAAVGHWALLLPAVLGVAGGTFHFVWCRRHGIHPLRATPRKKYWELRGWEWTE